MNECLPLLLPQPRRLALEQGAFALRGRHCSIYDATGTHAEIAHRVRQDVRRELHIDAELLADTGKGRAAAIVLQIDSSLPAQGYVLHVTPRHITLAGADAAGLFYGAMTLRQLVRQFREAIPACRIEDHPDFYVRGAMIDISRDKVPTMETLFRLTDELSEWKINRLELYMEHTFAYRNHRVVWEHADPMTAQEIRELDAFCAARHIDLVPNQNCFGHMHRWLRHAPYRELAECPNGYWTPWGQWRDTPFSLNPIDPRSLALVEELLEELLPNFRSRSVNVGCDETFDLGQGASREVCAREGKGRVYLDFLLKIHQIVARNGRVMHFWGDIVLNHPELIGELPRNIIPLVWGYEATHPFASQCAPFAAAGLPFFVCPGTATWNSILGRLDTALANLDNAAENGLAAGARGFLVTAWGDNGHWQPYAADLLPLAAGAARAWCRQSNRAADLVGALDMHVFRDEARVLGQLASELGLVYRELDHPIVNASALFRLVSQRDISDLRSAIPADRMRAARARLDALREDLARARSRRDDSALVRTEWEAAIALAKCGLARGLGERPDWRAAIDAYRAQWLARNRPGGLEDSVATLEARASQSQ